MGEPIASTGRMFVVAARLWYRHGASKVMRNSWTWVTTR
jgi:hypothetical protein